jgi:hypothetical protein
LKVLLAHDYQTAWSDSLKVRLVLTDSHRGTDKIFVDVPNH